MVFLMFLAKNTYSLYIDGHHAIGRGNRRCGIIEFGLKGGWAQLRGIGDSLEMVNKVWSFIFFRPPSGSPQGLCTHLQCQLRGKGKFAVNTAV